MRNHNGEKSRMNLVDLSKGLVQSASPILSRYGILLGIVSLIAFGLGLFAVRINTGAASINPDPNPTPLAPTQGIAFIESGLGDPVFEILGIDMASLSEKEISASGSKLAQFSIPPYCEILESHAAPRGPWIAVQITCESKSYVQIVHTQTGKVKDVNGDANRDATFLAWDPAGKSIILRTDVLYEPSIVEVEIPNGKSTKMDIPGSAYELSFSPDGKSMLYVTSSGLGSGSELWHADSRGHSTELIVKDPSHILIHPTWSPRHDQFVIIRMEDSEVTYPLGELWFHNLNNGQMKKISNVDAGHGNRPSWSPDGENLVFIVRENPNDPDVEHNAKALKSNAYRYSILTDEIAFITAFPDSITEDPLWSPEGEFIAIKVQNADEENIWVFDVPLGQLKKLTHSGSASNPSWLVEE